MPPPLGLLPNSMAKLPQGRCVRDAEPRAGALQEGPWLQTALQVVVGLKFWSKPRHLAR